MSIHCSLMRSVCHTSVSRGTLRASAACSCATYSLRSHVTTPSNISPPNPTLKDTRANGQETPQRDDVLTTSIASSVLRLRNALETLSVAEQLKVQGEISTAASPLLSPPQPAQGQAMLGRAQGQGATPGVGDVSMTTTKSWVRNKRAKFWAIVHPTSPPTVRSSSAQGMEANPATASRRVQQALKELVQTNIVSSEKADQSLTCDNTQSRPYNSPFLGAPPDTQAKGTSLHTHQVTFHNQYKRDVAHTLSELLDKDPTFGPLLLEMLPAESRRLLLVIGTASEYFGADYDDVVEQVKEADRDRDYSISSTDYDAWAASSFEQRRQQQQQRVGGDDLASQAKLKLPTLPVQATVKKSQQCVADELNKGEKTSSAVDGSPAFLKRIVHIMQRVPPTEDKRGVSLASPQVKVRLGPTTKASSHGSSLTKMGRVARERWQRWGRARSTPTSTLPSASHIPWQLYRRLLLGAAAPFLAFGILDNGTLILAGDTIDRTMSQTFGLSAMTAAALGGVVSGVAGIQVHGLAERCTRAAPPALTAAQRCGPAYSRATRLGNTLGMVSGLLLGMLPLLFVGHSTEEKLREEDERLRREAARSRLRRLRAVHNEEQAARLSLEAEEHKALKALLARPFCSTS